MKKSLVWENMDFEISNVNAVITKLNNEEVLKVERDLDALPFDQNNMSKTVDEPTFVKLSGYNIKDGIVEVKVLSRLLMDAPDFARGFIGIAFRILFRRPWEISAKSSQGMLIEKDAIGYRNSREIFHELANDLEAGRIWLLLKS